MCAAPLAALARAQEEQNNVEWIPKLNAHAQNVCSALLLPSQNLKSVLVSIRHGFAPLETSRGRQEEQHTQFARRMETKVVVEPQRGYRLGLHLPTSLLPKRNNMLSRPLIGQIRT